MKQLGCVNRICQVIGGLSMMLLAPLGLRAQIGVGTTSPHPSAMMHISPGAGNNKGLILPAISSGNRVVLDSTQNMAQGLIFFDTDLQKFYYFHESPKQWFEMDHDWIRKDIAGGSPVVGTHIYSGVPGNVGIGTAATINPAAKLTVVGNQSIGNAAYTQDSIPPANGLTVQAWLGVGRSSPTPGYEFDVKGDGRFTGNVLAGGTITADKFVGEGAVPPGTIVMWSGTVNNTTNFDLNGIGVVGTKYEGWRICNGYAGQVPDLRGRFIVGATVITNVTNPGQGAGGYSNVEFNNTDYTGVSATNRRFGGEDAVTLGTGEIPGHTHPISHSHTATDNGHIHSISRKWNNTTGSSTGLDDETNASSSIGDTDTGYADISVSGTDTPNSGQNVGGGGAHENRPPYYALAYIIKFNY